MACSSRREHALPSTASRSAPDLKILCRVERTFATRSRPATCSLSHCIRIALKGSMARLTNSADGRTIAAANKISRR